MLTGDAKDTGEAVGEQLSIDEVHAELLPQHKVDRIETLDKQNFQKKSCFCRRRHQRYAGLGESGYRGCHGRPRF